MKVSIIGGGGTLGSCTAFALAAQKIAEEIVMIDVNRNVVGGHAFDMNLSMVGREVEVHAGGYKDMIGSDVVIIVAALPSRHETPPAEVIKLNVPVIAEAAKNISRYCSEAVVITASNPADSLSYAMYLSSSLDRKKVIGYNMNDTLRFRMAVSRALGVKSSEVDGIAMGEHTGSLTVLFSSVSVGGKPVSINEDLKRQIRQEIPDILHKHSSFNSGRAMGWTSAVGLSDMVRIIGTDAEKVVPCSVVLAGEYGYNDISLGVPAILGREGVHQILEWKLSADEKEELERAAVSLKSYAKIVNQIIGPKTI
jgi:malate dehydrogenase